MLRCANAVDQAMARSRRRVNDSKWSVLPFGPSKGVPSISLATRLLIPIRIVILKDIHHALFIYALAREELLDRLPVHDIVEPLCIVCLKSLSRP
jgi:hypothetical protein